MEKTTLWTRVGDWVRNSRRSLGWDSAETETDGVPADQGDRPSPDGSRGPGENGADSPPWYRLGGLRARVTEIGIETHRAAELLDSIRIQLERQSEGVQLANRTVDRLTAGLASAPDTMRAQADALASMQRRLDADAAMLKQIQENLSRLGGLGDTMKETTASVSGFAETSQKNAEALGEGLEKVRHAVSQLGDSSSSALRSLDALRFEVHERGDELTASSAALNKRLVWFTCSALALALIGVVMGALALLR